MSKITPNSLEEIKSRLNIADIVKRYVDLRQAGTRLVGVCPFHEESKPSFSVNPELGLFYCFGCQASGDIIDFYSRINGLNFVQAVQELAEMAGVKLEEGRKSPGSDKKREFRKRCFSMHALAQEYFQDSLSKESGKEAREYLIQRGISKEIAKDFGLGWSPGQWHGLQNYLSKQGFSPEEGVQSGLLSKNQSGRIYDRFRSRVTFPIYDLSGRIVAFGGRIIGEGEPKYLNSSESPIFKKGDQLYGLYQARKSITQSKEVVLTEGYADVLALAQYGFRNCCGVLGTALTKEQVHRLAGLSKKVFLVFDGDRAGQQASLRSAEMILSFGLQARVLTLPEKDDVDSLLRTQGPEVLQEMLKKSTEGLEFCINMIRYQETPREIMNWAISFLNGFQDKSYQAYYFPRVAEGLNLSSRELRQALSIQGKAKSSLVNSAIRPNTIKSPAKRDRELLKFAVLCPRYLPKLEELGLDCALQTSRGKEFWKKLTRYKESELLQYLDEGEKKFYVQSKMQEDNCLKPDQVWPEIKSLLQNKKRQEKKKDIQEALRNAQAQGNLDEVNDLLKKYSSILGGNNEHN